MNSVEKARAFYELVELVNLYYEERDMPAEVDFFLEMEQLCEKLDIDFTEFRRQFGVKKYSEMF